MDIIITILFLAVIGVYAYSSVKKSKLRMKNLKAQNAFYNAGVKFFTAAEKDISNEKA